MIMADSSKSYVVRRAGNGSRPGKLYATYPYTLGNLLRAIDDARLESYAHGPHIVMVAEGRNRTVIRRFENGKEIPDGS